MVIVTVVETAGNGGGGGGGGGRGENGEIGVHKSRRWPCGADGVISTVQLLPGRNAAERR